MLNLLRFFVLEFFFDKGLVLDIPFDLLLCQFHLLLDFLLGFEKNFVIKVQFDFFGLLVFRPGKGHQEVAGNIDFLFLQLMLMLLDSLCYFHGLPTFKILVTITLLAL